MDFYKNVNMYINKSPSRGNNTNKPFGKIQLDNMWKLRKKSERYGNSNPSKTVRLRAPKG